MEQTAVWAHRGASAYKAENTMEAFELAIKQGADGLELDVHLSADEKIVVTHDENTSRVTGQNYQIKEMSWEKIQNLNFAWFRHNGETASAPLLENVLDLVKKENVTLNIELKNSVERYDGLEEKVLAAVRAFNVEEQIIYSSFNHQSMKKMKTLGAKSEVGLLTKKLILNPGRYARAMGAEAIHPYYRFVLLPDYLKNCQDAGIKVHAWTVNQEKDMVRLYKKQCQAIITNYPDVAIRIRKQFIDQRN